MFDDETTVIYRNYVLEHYKLIPYLYTTGNQAREQGISSITPLQPPDKLHPIHNPEPTTYSYLLGEHLLIHPVLTNMDDELSNVNVGFSHVAMTFPGVETDQWLDYFKPFDLSAIHNGNTKTHKFVKLNDYAVYVKRGSMIPLAPTATTLLAKDKDYTSSPVIFTWYAPVPNTPQVTSEVREYEGSGLIGTAVFKDNEIALTISAHDTRNGGFEVYGITEPSDVSVEQAKLSVPCVHHYLERESKLTVKCAALSAGKYMYYDEAVYYNQL